MINSITSKPAPAAPVQIKPNQSARKVYQTPFGDVMMDELGHKFLNKPAPAATPSNRAPAAASPSRPAVVTQSPAPAAASPGGAPAKASASAAPAAAAPSPTTPASASAGTTAALSSTTTAAGPSNASTPDPHSIPTPQSVFGDDVWVKQPEFANPNGTRGSYNPIYFATKATAEKIAAMVGGKVVEQNALADNVFHQSVPNQMIELPNGARVNAGLIADFYNHGYPQYYVDMMVQAEIRGATV